MGLSKRQWLLAALCGLGGVLATCGLGLYGMEMAPVPLRVLGSVIGAIAGAPGGFAAILCCGSASLRVYLVVVFSVVFAFWATVYVLLVKRSSAKRRARL